MFTDADGAWWMAYHAWTAPAVGYPAGVRSLQQAWQAATEGIPLATYAESRQELAAALQLFGT